MNLLSLVIWHTYTVSLLLSSDQLERQTEDSSQDFAEPEANFNKITRIVRVLVIEI